MRLGWLLPLFALAACAPAPSGAVLRMHAERYIDAPPAAVWARASDPLQEHGLRRERLSFSADGPLAEGTVYTETISVGLVNGYLMQVRVDALEPEAFVRMVSLPGRAGRFTAERRFLPEAQGTRLAYTVTADDRVVRDIAVLPVPFWLAKIVYEADMHTYLRNLSDAVAP